MSKIIEIVGTRVPLLNKIDVKVEEYQDGDKFKIITEDNLNNTLKKDTKFFVQEEPILYKVITESKKCTDRYGKYEVIAQRIDKDV